MLETETCESSVYSEYKKLGGHLSSEEFQGILTWGGEERGREKRKHEESQEEKVEEESHERLFLYRKWFKISGLHTC